MFGIWRNCSHEVLTTPVEKRLSCCVTNGSRSTANSTRFSEFGAEAIHRVLFLSLMTAVTLLLSLTTNQNQMLLAARVS
jgi:hypothetical protein